MYFTRTTKHSFNLILLSTVPWDKKSGTLRNTFRNPRNTPEKNPTEQKFWAEKEFWVTHARFDMQRSVIGHFTDSKLTTFRGRRRQMWKTCGFSVTALVQPIEMCFKLHELLSLSNRGKSKNLPFLVPWLFSVFSLSMAEIFRRYDLTTWS